MKYSFAILGVCVIIILFFVSHKSLSPSVADTNTAHTQEISQVTQATETQRIIFDTMKKRFVHEDGMVESDVHQTTSESQSYAMLMAVYANDQTTFDTVWRWTQEHLQTRPHDTLFAWLWRGDRVVDSNSATDADTDIAYALYLAHIQWKNDAYLTESTRIIQDIWNIETHSMQDMRYVTAGSWVVQDDASIVMNPSYLMPATYRVFATFDTHNNWLSLVDSSYHALEVCSGSKGLAMDWCRIDVSGRKTSYVSTDSRDTTLYSYDALRVPYRVAVDYKDSHDFRALKYLGQASVFADDWNKHGKIFATYNQQSGYTTTSESLASYGSQLASMSIIHRDIANAIIGTKIASGVDWNTTTFYDMSWVYFGLHAYAL